VDEGRTRAHLLSPEPESIQQAVSDKVPGRNRELGRVDSWAELNRRQDGKEELDTAGGCWHLRRVNGGTMKGS
jgi:hypothetical protein